MKISKKAAKLFAEAQEVAPQARAEFVHDACGADKALFDEVASLLEAADQSEGFFERLSGKVGLSALADRDPTLPENKVIGQWRLKRVIGRGGMGAVYLADRADGQFEQQAALKILPFGLDSQAARARFLTERQILARLTHDSIARLLDGGVTDEGTPYFVMDYVDGLPIDAYCDEHQLDVDARIRLFLGVLAAVSHAHSHLIVHRDIKPSNVLVSSDGSVKLLDFGIAKLLSNEAGAGDTREFGVALTPDFAAPEQLVGGAITTATDVFTLGLLLYALLAGRNPRGSVDTSSVVSLQAVAAEDPPRLSDFATDQSQIGQEKIAAIAAHRKTSLAALRRNLKGDLDNIMQKALRVDAGDRYASVADLSTDLQRFLNDEPVTAQPITVSYRVNKFVRRHRGGVLMASLVLIALVASTAITAWQMVEARQQRDIALYQQQRIQANNEFYGLLMEEMGSKPFTSVELLDRGRELLQKQFGVEDAFMGPVLFEVSMRYGGLNERPKQLELLHQAEQVAREHEDDNLLATVLCKMHDSYALKDPEQARKFAAEGNEIFGSIRRPDLRTQLECLRMNARIAERDGDIERAIEILFAGKEILDSHPAAVTNLRGPLLAHIAYTYYNAGRMEDSISYLDQVLELLDRTGRGNSLGYLRVTSNKAVTLQNAGRLAEALAVFEGVVKRLRESGYDNRGAASMMSQYGGALVRVGKIEEAEAAYLEGLQVAEAAGDEQNIATINSGMVNVYGARKEFDRALESQDAAQTYYMRDESADRVSARMLKVQRAKLLRSMGRVDDALVEVEALLDEVGYPDTERGPGLLSAIIQAVEVHKAKENYARAEELATDLIRRFRERSVGDPMQDVDVGSAHLQRAEVRVGLGQNDAAIEDLELGISILALGLGEEHERTLKARQLLESIRP